MSKKQRILKTIYDAVDEINSLAEKERQLERSKETVLFGRDGKLDSLGLVNLIVAVEENLEDEFERAIVLVDDRAMSQENSPFQTIGSLADYIVRLLQEEIVA